MDSGALAAQLAAYDQNKVTSTDALNKALATYGVPEIRNTVSGLRTTVANTTNALNNVDPSVTGRTSGSLVTEAQRQKQVNNERAPIAGQLQSQTGALGQNEQDLNDALGQATTLATNQVNDYNAGRNALQSEYDTTYKREQDAATTAREQAAQQEAIRQFNESQATSRGSASYGGGGSTSAAATKQATQQAITTNLAKASGSDGFVSRASFGAALNDWESIGGTTRTFWQQYGRYVNPATKSQYPGFAQR